MTRVILFICCNALPQLSWPKGERVMKVADAVSLTSPYVGCVTLDVKTYQNK